MENVYFTYLAKQSSCQTNQSNQIYYLSEKVTLFLNPVTCVNMCIHETLSHLNSKSERDSNSTESCQDFIAWME